MSDDAEGGKPNGKGGGRGGPRPNSGGARAGAGRPKGRRSTSTLKKEEMRRRAAARALGPVEFMLMEMRNQKNPKPMRLELARWVAPYLSPRLASVEVVKSVRGMTLDELEWAVADAQRGTASAPRPIGWWPRVVR